ncbi:hypothetical protein KBA73_02540 [Patescibacteria group bacterium]|nr:hypothetical protein [Patescibacteria group bacterium]
MEQYPSSEVPTQEPPRDESTNQAPVPPVVTIKTEYQFDPKEVERLKYIAALSYLGILVFIPLFLRRESKFVRLHAAQGVLLLAAWMVGMVVFWIPLIGWLLGIFLLVANIVVLLKCLQGEFWEIPFLGEYRSRLGLDEK